MDGKPGASAGMQACAAPLCAFARMEQRFWRFENLSLRAMLSQTDRDFHFIVLTLTIMPQVYLDQLRELVAGHARFPSRRGTAFLASKLPGQDRQPTNERGLKPRGLSAITDQKFTSHLARDFPYLDAPALVAWASAQLATQLGS